MDQTSIFPLLTPEGSDLGQARVRIEGATPTFSFMVLALARCVARKFGFMSHFALRSGRRRSTEEI